MAPDNTPEIDPLTDLTADLASLEHLETGFAGVMGRLQPLVPFYDAELWMADSERQRAVLVACVAPLAPPSQPRANAHGEFSRPLDPTFARWFALLNPEWWEGADLAARYPGDQPLRTLREARLTHSVTLPLRCRERTVGLWILHFDQPAYDRRAQYERTVEKVAVQLAIALRHYQDRNALEVLKTDTDLLLEINHAVVAVRQMNPLFALLATRLQPVLDFAGTSLCLPDEQRQRMRVFSPSANPQMPEAEAWVRQLRHEWMPYEPSFNTWLEARGPVAWQVEDYAARYPDCAIYQRLRKAGARGSLALTLRGHGEVIGFWLLHTTREDYGHVAQYPLLNQLTDLMALAVLNILNEEGAQRYQREKTLLLEINNALLFQPRYEDKFAGVAQAINSLIPHDYFGIATPQGSPIEATMNIRLRRVGGGYEVHPVEADYEQMANIPPDVFERELASLGVLLGHAAVYAGEQYRALTQHHLLIRAGHDVDGIRSLLFLPLVLEDGTPITLYLASKQPYGLQTSDLDTMQLLVAQLLMSLQNVRANEEIAAREREKTLLLEISEQIAQQTTLTGLFDTVNSQLMPTLGHYGGFVLMPTADGTQFYVVVDAAPDALRASPGWEAATSTLYPFDDINRDWLNLTAPQHWTTTQQLARLPTHGGFQYLRSIGTEYGIVVPMRINNESVGLLLMLFRDRGAWEKALLTLLANVGYFVAIAVRNLMADEVLYQEKERKAMLLAVNSALISSVGHVQRLVGVANAIRQLRAIDCMAVYFCQSPPPDVADFSLRLIWQDGQFVLPAAEYAWQIPREGQPPAYFFETLLQKSPPDGLLARRYSEEELASFSHSYPPTSPGAPSLPVRSFMQVPMHLDGGIIIMLCLGSKQALFFTDQDQATLEELSSQVVLALENLLVLRRNAALRQRLQEENAYLVGEATRGGTFEDIIGNSPLLLEMFEKIEQVAPTLATVLIVGETGTGKELIARAIHNHSPRKDRPLIRVNCAALPENLIESELFGHEKGSFTGATERRIGKFELANGSTIFLDEIGELPLALQPKLLRVLQEKEIERLGGREVIKLDVRVLAATNRNLIEEVTRGNFRADLYYRLDVFPITTPSLRERPEDITLLANFFLQKYARNVGKRMQGIAPDTLADMLDYAWPGNVRELEHVIQSAVITCRTPLLELKRPLQRSPQPLPTPAGRVEAEPEAVLTLEETERRQILRALKVSMGKIKGPGGAADLLGVHPNTLQSRMKRLGIVRTHVDTSSE